MSAKNISLSLSNRIIKNLAAVFFGDIISKFIAIFTTIYLARYLEPEKYGIYSFVTSYLFIFLVIADFGLNDLIIRDIAKDRALAVKYFKASAIIKALLSIVCTIAMISLVIVMGYSHDKVIYTIIISISIFFICMNNTIASFFKAFEKMGYSAFLTILGSLLLLLFCLVLIYFKGSLQEVMISRVIAVCIVTILGLAMVWSMIGRHNEPIDRAFIKKLVMCAFPFLTNGIIHTLYFSADVIMLSKMKGDVYVGWFTPAANDLFFSLMIIPGAVSTVVYPIFSRQYGNAKERLIVSCNFSIKMLTIIGVAISAGTCILAPQIINLIFGPKYENAVIVLRIISLVISVAFISGPIGYALSAVGEVKALLKVNLIILILSVALNLLLIPHYGHIGATITMSFCTFLSMLIGYNILNRKVGGIIIFNNFIKPIVAACIMSIAIYMLLSLHISIIIVSAAVVYIISILLLKTFNENEMIILKGLLDKTS